MSKLWHFFGHLMRLIIWLEHAATKRLQHDQDNRFWKKGGFSWTRNGWDWDSDNPGLYPSNVSSKK